MKRHHFFILGPFFFCFTLPNGQASSPSEWKLFEKSVQSTSREFVKLGALPSQNHKIWYQKKIVGAFDSLLMEEDETLNLRYFIRGFSLVMDLMGSALVERVFFSNERAILFRKTLKMVLESRTLVSIFTRVSVHTLNDLRLLNLINNHLQFVTRFNANDPDKYLEAEHELWANHLRWALKVSIHRGKGRHGLPLLEKALDLFFSPSLFPLWKNRDFSELVLKDFMDDVDAALALEQVGRSFENTKMDFRRKVLASLNVIEFYQSKASNWDSSQETYSSMEALKSLQEEIARVYRTKRVSRDFLEKAHRFFASRFAFTHAISNKGTVTDSEQMNDLNILLDEKIRQLKSFWKEYRTFYNQFQSELVHNRDPRRLSDSFLLLFFYLQYGDAGLLYVTDFGSALLKNNLVNKLYQDLAVFSPTVVEQQFQKAVGDYKLVSFWAESMDYYALKRSDFSSFEKWADSYVSLECADHFVPKKPAVKKKVHENSHAP